jgi:hypothetical protein
MQLNNYLIALALTMSVCLLALTMRTTETITMLQPVLPDEARNIYFLDSVCQMLPVVFCCERLLVNCNVFLLFSVFFTGMCTILRAGDSLTPSRQTGPIYAAQGHARQRE